MQTDEISGRAAAALIRLVDHHIGGAAYAVEMVRIARMRPWRDRQPQDVALVADYDLTRVVPTARALAAMSDDERRDYAERLDRWADVIGVPLRVQYRSPRSVHRWLLADESAAVVAGWLEPDPDDCDDDDCEFGCQIGAEQ